MAILCAPNAAISLNVAKVCLLKPRIGIYAGTFDPIHNGHLAFAHEALKTGLDKILFLVEPRPRRKQGVRALEHRHNMVELAIKDEPNFGTIALGQARFNVQETLPVLQALFPDHMLVFLFGDDVISHIAHWPHRLELLQQTELLVAVRRQKRMDLEATFQTLQQTTGVPFRYSMVEPNAPDIASSKIRLQIRRQKDTPDIPLSVAHYIKKKRLYASDSTGSK